jgi:hypothetical protein
MTIQPDTLELEQSPSLFEYTTTTTKHHKLALLLLDHISAPIFNLASIQTDIWGAFPKDYPNFTLHQPPWLNATHTQHAPTSHARFTPTTHPGLEFLTTQPIYFHPRPAPTHPQQAEYKKLAETDILSTILGHPPQKLIYTMLHSANHKPEATTADKHNFITSRLLNTSQTAHARLRKWRLQNKYSTQNGEK